MTSWIALGVTIFLLLCSVIAFFMRESSRRTESEGRDAALKIMIETLRDTFELKMDNMACDVTEIRNILGNGHGLKADVTNMKITCAGEMQKVAGEIKEVKVRLSAQQHEINDIKERA